MQNLAAIPAILVVTAALAGLALWLLRRVENVGRSGPRCLVAFLATWLAALVLGAVGARFGYERQYHALPGFWAVYLPAVALAFGAALPLAWWLGRSPKTKAAPPRKTQTQSAPPPEPDEVSAAEVAADFSPPPESEITVFKFACPHCGQRLAVTMDEVGNAANCPNCAILLEVPSPTEAARM